MNVIPIHDDTAPIACTASGPQLAERIDAIGRLREHLEHVERTEHGLLLLFPQSPLVAEELAGFVVDEKACCAFWGFATDSSDGTITLRWDGPPAVEDVLDRLLDFFRSDTPLTALDGLL